MFNEVVKLGLPREDGEVMDETSSLAVGTGNGRRHTHRYNTTNADETTSGMGGSRNSKTTDRLSGGTVGSHC